MSILSIFFHISHLMIAIQERFLFFTKPSTKSEYMSSGVLYSAGFFKGSSCLRFYYYMRAGGYLRVFIKESVSKKRNPFVMIWEKQGHQGNRWNWMEKSISGAMIKVRCVFHFFLRCECYFFFGCTCTLSFT